MTQARMQTPKLKRQTRFDQKKGAGLIQPAPVSKKKAPPEQGFKTQRRSVLNGATHSHPQPRALALDLSGFAPPIRAYQPIRLG